MNRGNDNGFEEWGGYMQAKIGKLEEQFVQSSDCLRQSNLFAGISIYVNGLTNPSADQLKRIMMVNGGIYHHYERSHTTYIIASNLPDVKIRNMNTSNIIRPDWVVDCVKENRILDYTKYLLYTNHKPSQPKLNFKKKELEPDKKTEPLKEAERKADRSITAEDEKCLNILEGLDNVHAPSPELLPEEKEPKPEPEIKKPPPPKIAKSAVDPNFLSEFYNNSRLHHIATLGAGFKQYVSELREKHSGTFPHRDEVRSKLPKTNSSQSVPQTIMHIDMDCFFVSVGLRSRPHLRGVPVAVTHSKGGDAAVRPGSDRQKERDLYLKRLEEKSGNYMKREKIQSGFEGNESLSEIASCSYEARKMGVRNGMFVGQALKLCPGLKTIPYDFEEYKEVAFTLYNIVAQYTLNIEAVSCDEMFVDLSDVLKDLQVEPMEFVAYLRDEVKTKTGCPCSAGVGGNRLQARMATKKAKPDGQFFLSPENVEEYMSAIPFSDLPGVGYSTSYTLEQLNLKTCGDLQRLSLGKLQQELGKKFGETLYQFCRGIDNRPLVYGQIRKSISAEVNYGIRFTEYEELEKFLQQLCAEVHSRLLAIKRRGKCITLKLMVRAKEAPVETSKYMGHGYCDNLTKSTTLQEYTSDLGVITKTILNTMKSLNLPPKELRGIGIHIAKLDNPEDGKAKKENVLKTMFSKVAEKQKEISLAPKEPTGNVTEQQKEQSASIESKPREPIVETASKTPVKAIPEKRKSSPTTPDKDKKPSNVPKKTRGKAKTVKQVDVSNMLQNAATKRKTPEPLPPDIDYAVLAELPEDIREEVLREHRQLMKMKTIAKKPQIAATATTTKPSTSTVDTDFLQALPPELRMEVERDLKRQLELNTADSNDTKPTNSEKVVEADNVTQSENIFDQKNCRQLIESWVDSSDSPEDCDVDLFAQNAQELVQMKRIAELLVPLRLLHRLIGMKSNCAWHASYRTILGVVQREMVAMYGSRMMIEDEIRCDNC